MEPEINLLAASARTAIITAVLVLGLYFLRRAGAGPRLAVVSWALLVAILVSAAVGIEYAVFQLPAALRDARFTGSITVHHYYGLSAAVIFVWAQLMAVFHIGRGDSRYLGWLLPAIAYLFVIGLFGAFGFGIIIMLFADTARAVLLLGLTIGHQRARAA